MAEADALEVRRQNRNAMVERGHPILDTSLRIEDDGNDGLLGRFCSLRCGAGQVGVLAVNAQAQGRRTFVVQGQVVRMAWQPCESSASRRTVDKPAALSHGVHLGHDFGFELVRNSDPAP